VAVLDTIEPGRWDPTEHYHYTPGAFGLLLIEGVIARDLRLAGRSCSELLGPGDLLRPWDYTEGALDTVRSVSAWTVLERARIAVLDDRFARVACRWPELVAGLVGRTLRRSRWTAILLGISNLTRVDLRITALMWHLADRWGHVTPEGVVVPVPLTHEMIGKLVGAHRPSVTSALGELQREGAITRREDGWVLHGDPPERLENGSRTSGLSIDPGLAATLTALAASWLG
jgi:CRP-like cAMP-binding protein